MDHVVVTPWTGVTGKNLCGLRNVRINSRRRVEEGKTLLDPTSTRHHQILTA
jgi:hypothetical protein